MLALVGTCCCCCSSINITTSTSPFVSFHKKKTKNRKDHVRQLCSVSQGLRLSRGNIDAQWLNRPPLISRRGVVVRPRSDVSSLPRSENLKKKTKYKESQSRNEMTASCATALGSPMLRPAAAGAAGSLARDDVLVHDT